MQQVQVRTLRDFNDTTDLAMAQYFVLEGEDVRLVVDGRYASRNRPRRSGFEVLPQAVRAIIRPIQQGDHIVVNIGVHDQSPRQVFDTVAMLGKTKSGETEILALGCGGDVCAVAPFSVDDQILMGVPKDFGLPSFFMR